MDEAAAYYARQSQHDRRQRRRDKVVLLSLVEMLTIITFISVGMAFVTQQDVDLTRDWRSELADAQERNHTLQQELTSAQETIARQERELAILWDAYYGQPLPSDAALRREMLERMRSTQGFGMPACPSPDGLLLRVETYVGADGADTFRAFPSWTPADAETAEAIPGVASLTHAAAPLDRAQFSALAMQVRAHGEAQPFGCRFMVLLDEQHENLRLYKSEVRFLRAFFRVRASE